MTNVLTKVKGIGYRVQAQIRRDTQGNLEGLSRAESSFKLVSEFPRTCAKPGTSAALAYGRLVVDIKQQKPSFGPQPGRQSSSLCASNLGRCCHCH